MALRLRDVPSLVRAPALGAGLQIYGLGLQHVARRLHQEPVPSDGVLRLPEHLRALQGVDALQLVEYETVPHRGDTRLQEVRLDDLRLDTQQRG